MAQVSRCLQVAEVVLALRVQFVRAVPRLAFALPLAFKVSNRTPLRMAGIGNVLPLAKAECRPGVLPFGCAWKLGAGKLPWAGGRPAVRSKGEDHDERDFRSRTG